MRPVWLDRRTVEQLTRWPLRTIQWKAKRGELRSRYLEQRERNGRRAREFALSSLPPEAQEKYFKEGWQAEAFSQGPAGSKISPAAQGETSDSTSYQHAAARTPRAAPHSEANQHGEFQRPLFQPTEPTSEERAALPPTQLRLADERYKAIAALLDFRRRTNGHRPLITTHDGQRIDNLDSLAAWLAPQHKCSRSSLWRWLRAWDAGGFAALARRTRRDKGTSRFFGENPAARKLAEAKYLNERLSVQLVTEALVRQFGKDAPGYFAVRAYLARLPKPIVTYARTGEQAFTDRCQPFLLTDFSKLRVNQIWVSDHGKHDVWVRNDSLPGAQQDAALRLWMTAILDMRSRRIVAAVWCVNPSSHSISSALRIGITASGLPDTFYIDNGKDYEKVGRVGLSPECSGVLARLGIKAQYCIPRHPQSKLIESFFSTVRKRFDSRFRPFYCGSSPKQRPEDCSLVLKKHELWLKGKAESTPLRPASEFMQIAQGWIAEYNAHHEHSGRGMNGRAPDEVFNELLPADQRKAVPNERWLDVLFWERQKRKVREGGTVELLGQRYEPADEQSGAALFLAIEREVIVAFDPLNVGEAIVLNADGRFLGRVQAQKLIERGPTSHADIQASMRMRARIRKFCKGYLDHVALGVETDAEMLRRQAGIARPALPPASRRLVAAATAAAPAAKPVYVEDLVNDYLKGED